MLRIVQGVQIRKNMLRAQSIRNDFDASDPYHISNRVAFKTISMKYNFLYMEINVYTPTISLNLWP